MPARRNGAALLTLLMILAIVVLPAALLTVALINEAASVYQRIQTGSLDPEQILVAFESAIPAWLSDALDRLGIGNLAAAKDMFGGGAAAGVRAVLGQAPDHIQRGLKGLDVCRTLRPARGALPKLKGKGFGD